MVTAEKASWDLTSKEKTLRMENRKRKDSKKWQLLTALFYYIFIFHFSYFVPFASSTFCVFLFSYRKTLSIFALLTTLFILTCPNIIKYIKKNIHNSTGTRPISKIQQCTASTTPEESF
jgi:hypothetical protein